MNSVYFYFSAWVLLLLPVAAVHATDSAHEWLMKINHAARNLNYEGTFVYAHNGTVEAMRIVHINEKGKSRERLVSLNGVAREIIRNEREVLCFLPDEQSVMVEHRKVDVTHFPTLLPRNLSDLDANYEFQLGKTARVADRLTQQVIVKPRDGYRYGYHFWADRETGLLLQADLRDAQGKLLEQFMFTHAVIGGKIAEFALQPQSESKSFTWHREAEGAATPATPAWSAAKLPNGFKLATHLSRQSPRRKVPTQHLVYTDGLATVSVFIERSGKNEALALRGASHMGAVHASTTRQNEFQITAVGEVPMETVHLIAHAMTPTR